MCGGRINCQTEKIDDRDINLDMNKLSREYEKE